VPRGASIASRGTTGNGVPRAIAIGIPPLFGQ
jgi:hypothetical protein